MRSYDLGRFQDAIREFEAAYELNDDPAYLYNLAQAHRRAGNSQKAVELYRTYLRKAPEASDRETVEQRIAALEKDLASAAAQGAATAPVAPPPPIDTPAAGAPPIASAAGDPPGRAPPRAPGAGSKLGGDASGEPPRPADRERDRGGGDASPGRGLRIAGLGLGAGGLLLGAAGALFLVRSNDKRDQAARAPVFNPALEDEAGSLRSRSYLFFALAGAALATGAVLLAFGLAAGQAGAGHPGATAAVVPQVAPGQAGLAYVRSF
jgi:tetratricopeptide (TPR) repeat protein